MALFAVQTRSQNLLDRDVIVKFFDYTAERLKSPNPYKNPLKGKVRKYINKEIFVVNMEPLYFNFSWFGWPIAAGALLIGGFGWWVIPGLLLGCFGVFWSRKFFYYICVKGLRKAGYNGPVEMLNYKQIIEGVVL